MLLVEGEDAVVKSIHIQYRRSLQVALVSQSPPAPLELAEAKYDVPPFPMWQSTRINPPCTSYATTACVDIVTLIHTFTPDLMSHCIRSSIARQAFQSSRKITFPSINRSFTNASPKMDPVSAGLNSLPTTNGESKPALRFADVRRTPPSHLSLR